MKILRIFILLTSTKILYAVNATPDLISVQQPDGTQIECYIKGDEWSNWHETINGYSIVKNGNGLWVYAEDVAGRSLLPGSRVVGQNLPPLNIEKHLTPIPDYRPIHNSNVNLNATRTDTFHVPVIYFQFPDTAVIYPLSDIDNIFNQEGYGHPGNPGSGSYREYYEEISYGQFSPVAYVVGVFIAPHNHDYYSDDHENSGARQRQLMRAMVDSAEGAGMNWSQFDNDGDGDVDGVTLVHAGPGAEEGDGSNIWSHRWTLGSHAVTYDGVFINDYNVNPELQGTGIVAIGVIAHEFGHVLGLPDLYDTDGSSSGSGKLALMASGSWGTAGNTPWYPAAMNAWSKTEMGWSNVVAINTEATNMGLEQSYTSNTIYRVNNPEDNSEYWLIENRQKRGTDVLMPAPGLLFWHIDTEKTSQGGAPNNDEPHYGVGLEQADGLFELENDGSSDGADPYPGLTDNHEFTHYTAPSTVSYYYQPSTVAFTNISNADSIMTFDVSFDDVIYTALGNAIDFAGNVLGSPTTGSVWITNTGSDTLDISAVTVSGTGFSTAVTSLSIVAGDTAAIAVSFAPTAAQDYTGMLTCSTNTTTMPTDTFALSGYGVDAVFFEDFYPYTGSVTDLPMDGWTIVDGNGDADSVPQYQRTWYHDNDGVDDSGNMVAYIGFSNSYSASEQLTTPSFTVTEPSGVYMDVYSAFNPHPLNVIQVNSDSTRDTLGTITPGTSYDNYSFVLNDTGTMQIEFDFSPDSGGSFAYLNLDNVKVAALPTDPVYTALDSAIDFADNVLGSTTTDSVWITNTGVDTLDISAVTVSGTGFNTAVTSLSIAVGDTAAIDVSFAPTVEQDYTGMLTFSTNDSTMLTDTIPLSGYGVDAVFFENFDPYTGSNTDLPMAGWTIVDGNGDATSVPQRQRTWYHDNDGVDNSGNMVAYIGFSNSYSASEQLITPSFTVSELSGVYMDVYSAFNPHPLNVIQVNSDGTKDTLGTITPGTSYDNYGVVLNDTGTMQIEFDFSPDSGGSFAYLNLDNVKVAALPAVTISDSSGFRMMSSPVSGPIYGDLLAELWTQGMTGGDLTSGPANVWTYADTGWSALTDITPSGDTLTAGQGFLVYVFADTDFDGTDDLPVTLSVSGTENSGSITVPSVGSIADSAWELAGNPYASTIVWDSVIQTNVFATAYVWNNAIADYISWNGITGDLSNGLIAPFQGFWVQGNGGSGSITILIADTSSTAGTFYKTMHDSSTGSMSFTITAGAYSDQAYVSFMNNGMAGIDNADAYKLLPLTVSERVVGITYADGQSLAINNLPYVMDDALAIPLDVMYLTVDENSHFVTAENDVTLTWDLSNLPETVVGLTLTDNITSDTYDLLNPEQDAIFITPVAKGSFSADGSGGVNIYPQLGDSHFTLTVAYSALSAEDESTLPKEFALHRIYPNPFNPSATISFDIPPVETYNNTLLRVYDIKGRRVATLVDAPYKPGTHTVQWHPQNFSSGLYIVQFKAGDKTFNQKITFIK